MPSGPAIMCPIPPLAMPGIVVIVDPEESERIPGIDFIAESECVVGIDPGIDGIEWRAVSPCCDIAECEESGLDGIPGIPGIPAIPVIPECDAGFGVVAFVVSVFRLAAAALLVFGFVVGFVVGFEEVFFFAGGFFAVAFVLVAWVLVVSTIPGIPGIPVCWADRLELVPANTASTAANAATYFLDGIVGRCLLMIQSRQSRPKCEIGFSDLDLTERGSTPLAEAALDQETDSRGATRWAGGSYRPVQQPTPPRSQQEPEWNCCMIPRAGSGPCGRRVDGANATMSGTRGGSVRPSYEWSRRRYSMTWPRRRYSNLRRRKSGPKGRPGLH
jgi:hypothetical protein